ncbi:DNA polymerase IV [Paroceanicella profunda]|uniref:DNA polymerase IV n=1 Tax=Paroceanicella profunda TaxID=2579971 RepID=A0A5B8FU30_9RHOB|nr:DNA polymerase IV [Paroceanicella profunda]QDL92316.1 DNA polymerase IV [Paroceanicella profunda]
MPALCLDCGSRTTPPRCRACGSPRLSAHDELFTLSIAHLDCDAFYASVEKRDAPELADKPVIIGGGKRGVVSTACYVARIRGVRSAMPMFKALALCPDAVVIRPRISYYAEISRQIRAMMDDLTPLVQPLSLDEAFLDLSGTEALHRASPAEMMARLLIRIERELGLTASVGLSHNKFLAKLASEFDKPRGFSVVGRAETLARLAPLPVRAILGVGPAFAATLEREGIRTVADIRRQGAETMLRRHGQAGQRLWQLAHGEDRRRVTPHEAVKSISSETTFERDERDADILDGHLWRLAEKTSDRAKAKDLGGRTVTLKLKRADFRTITRRLTLEDPTQLAGRIYAAAAPLLARELENAPFRLIGVGISGLVAGADADRSDDLLRPDSARAAAVERAADALRARFGDGVILKGRALR